jgi:hypothetical protein
MFDFRTMLMELKQESQHSYERDGLFDAYDDFEEMEWLGADNEFSVENEPSDAALRFWPEVDRTEEEEDLLLSLVNEADNSFCTSKKITAGMDKAVARYRQRSDRFGIRIFHGPCIDHAERYEDPHVRYATRRMGELIPDKVVSMVPYYFLRDIMKRESIVKRLRSAQRIKKMTGLRSLPVLQYDILPYGFMSEPQFALSEYNNAILRKEALTKFCNLARGTYLMTFNAGGGGIIPQMSGSFKYIFVLMTSDFECESAVNKFANLESVKNRTTIRIIKLNITYIQLLKCSRLQFKDMVGPIVPLTETVFMHDFFPELEKFSTVFMASYGVYHLVSENDDWKRGTLPPRLAMFDEDSAMLTRYLMRQSEDMKPIYDPVKCKVAVYAQHAVFRDRVVLTDSSFSSVTQKQRLTDFVRESTRATTRMKVVYRLEPTGNTQPIDFELDMSGHLMPSFPVVVGKKVFFPAAKIYSEEINSTLSVFGDEYRFYRGKYYFFLADGVKQYVDYDRPDLSLVEKWRRLDYWGFRVPIPDPIPIYERNYAINPYTRGRFTKKWVVGPAVESPLVELAQTLALKPTTMIKIEGIGVNDFNVLVSDENAVMLICAGGPQIQGNLSPAIFAKNTSYVMREHPNLQSKCDGSVLITKSLSGDPVSLRDALSSFESPLQDYLFVLLSGDFIFREYDDEDMEQNVRRTEKRTGRKRYIVVDTGE